jgi:hypothetical protein
MPGGLGGRVLDQPWFRPPVLRPASAGFAEVRTSLAPVLMTAARAVMLPRSVLPTPGRWVC